jgi:hypothetical protein
MPLEDALSVPHELSFMPFKTYRELAEDIGPLQDWLDLWGGLTRRHFDYLVRIEAIGSLSLSKNTQENHRKWLASHKVYRYIFNDELELNVSVLNNERLKKSFSDFNARGYQKVANTVLSECEIRRSIYG